MKSSTAEALSVETYTDSYTESAGYTREALSEARRVAKLAEAMPDVREEIVASLRARIESGSYFVSADSIAERIMERALENRMR